MKTHRNPNSIHPPLAGYAHQIEIRGRQRWLVLSGQVGMRPDGALPEDALEQLEVALDNVLGNLEAAGMEVQDLVKLTFYLVGEMDAGQRRALTSAKMDGHEPCMTLLYVAGLANPALKVEVDAWASRPE